MSTSYDLEQYFFDLPARELKVGEIGDAMEILREQGSAELQGNGHIPISIRVIWTIGPGGCAEDLWDLRELIEGINDQLSDYSEGELKLGKPERVI